tara:strand:- start:427 stop:684 length:258 start_codon:yes stop_codon:yes gene_type:complete
MPNRNYIKGVRKERKIVNTAKCSGHIAFRSAGSHSPIDVCVINKKEKTIRLIQCKPDNMSDAAKKRLEDEHKELNDFYTVRFLVL